MLLSVRRTATRHFTKYARTMATSISSRDNATMQDALSTLGKESITIPARPVVATAASPLPGTPRIMNIPPEQDPLLHYMTSWFMKHGHRAKASRITSGILLHLHALTRQPPLPLLRQAILDASPAVRLLNHRHGGKTVSKPIALGEKQRTRFAVKDILDRCLAKNRPERSLELRVAKHVIAILQREKDVVKTKSEIHRLAMVNRGNIKNRL